jgi:hypothetical protein
MAIRHALKTGSGLRRTTSPASPSSGTWCSSLMLGAQSGMTSAYSVNSGSVRPSAPIISPTWHAFPSPPQLMLIWRRSRHGRHMQAGCRRAKRPNCSPEGCPSTSVSMWNSTIRRTSSGRCTWHVRMSAGTRRCSSRYHLRHAATSLEWLLRLLQLQGRSL